MKIKFTNKLCFRAYLITDNLFLHFFINCQFGIVFGIKNN